MTCMSGPPWAYGKTALSTTFANSSVQRIMPPRGPRSVLCVVVVTICACSTGFGVRGLGHGGARGHIRRGRGVRLHVGVLRAEERLRALDRERLGDAHPLAAAVVAPARIPLGVLVGEHAADRVHHRLARVVLRRDQLDLVDLAPSLVLDRIEDLGVDPLQLAHMALTFSRSSICFRRRSCLPPWTCASRNASTTDFASSIPMTRSPSVSRFRPTCSTPSRADHSLSTTAARTPGILFAATEGPMPEPQQKMPFS